MNGETVYLDGTIVPTSKALLPATSRAVLFGEGLFETVRAYDGKLFALGDHLQRLNSSALDLGIPVPDDLEQLTKQLPRLLSKNGLVDGVVRISVLAAETPGGYTAKANRSHLLATVQPLPMNLRKQRKSGVEATSYIAGSHPMAAHKSTAYQRSIQAIRKKNQADGGRVLFVDDEGFLLEGAVSNLFAIRDDALVTPPSDGRILPGITRKIVLEIASETKLPTVEKAIALSEVPSLDGLFVTNSVIELLPIVRLDGKEIGSGNGVGRPHYLVKMLHDLYRERVFETLGITTPGSA